MGSFQVYIDPALLPTWITIGDIGEANVSIANQNGKCHTLAT